MNVIFYLSSCRPICFNLSLMISYFHTEKVFPRNDFPAVEEIYPLTPGAGQLPPAVLLVKERGNCTNHAWQSSSISAQ